MQRQDVDAGTKAQAPGALGDGREEDILRGGQAVDGRRVVFGQVISVEAGCVEPLYLQEPLAVDAVQAQPRHRLDMVEDAESECHGASLFVRRRGYPDARSINLIDDVKVG